MKIPSLALILAMALVLMRPAMAGETELSEPKPSLDEPRRIVFALNVKDPATVNRIFSNAINVQKFYEMDNVELAIVAYGPGIRVVMKDHSPVPDRVQSLLTYGIEIIACRNTLDAIGVSTDVLLEGVDHVQAGIPELVERQLRGWTYIYP